MLFGYPEQAASENWIHDCVVAAVVDVHRRVADGQHLPAWPASFPQLIETRCRDGLDYEIT